MTTLLWRPLCTAMLIALASPFLGSQLFGEAPSGEHAKTLQIEFKSDEGTQSSLGEVVVDYPDGSMLLLTPNGRLWTIRHDDIISKTESDQTMIPLTSQEIYEQYKATLPSGFLVYKTRHYVVVYNTSDAYARWVAELFERLYTRGFYNYWKSQKVKLTEPRFPLVAVVFRDKASYLRYAEREIGESAKAMIGYYNLKTNRIVSYDLTGINGMVPHGSPIASRRMVNQILSRPEAERTVATIVHEAVHQISYNSGLQVRLADNPLWLSEGLAMFFESPDVGNSKGWGTIGKVNYHNFRLFAQHLRSRPADSLTTLITDDSRFRDAAKAARAYPESWALTYFLMKTKRKNYSAYLQELATFPPLGEFTSRERVELFKKHFGSDLQKLDMKFIQYMHRLR